MTRTANFGQFFIHGDADHNRRVEEGYRDDLIRQLDAHNVPVPDMVLFPENPDPQNSRYYEPRERQNAPHGLVIGCSFTEAARALLGRVTKRDVHDMRVLTALHELVHHIAVKMNCGVTLQKAQMDYPDHSPAYGDWEAISGMKINSNQMERLCDGASVLYMLSNYEGNADNLFRLWSDTRLASVSVVHNTASTMREVIQAYKAAPKRGLDIVECVEFTMKAMAKQDLELEQLRVVNVRSQLIQKSRLDQEIKDRYKIRPRLSQAAAEDVAGELQKRKDVFKRGSKPRSLSHRTEKGTARLRAPQFVL